MKTILATAALAAVPASPTALAAAHGFNAAVVRQIVEARGGG
ncbi:hypothetical protein [Phenylobacterium sp.]